GPATPKTLSAGTWKVKGGDSTLKALRFLTGTPSIVAPMSVTCICSTQSRSSAGVSPWNGGGSSVEHSGVMTGRNRNFPGGIVQLRLAVPETLITPTRYQTWPVCSALQLTLPSWKSGFAEVGMPRAHCHHAADHSA